jgi:hypothetical protein
MLLFLSLFCALSLVSAFRPNKKGTGRVALGLSQPVFASTHTHTSLERMHQS